MNLTLIDFETYYEPRGDYSLAKMPTAQYVRDPRFQCLGCAIDDGTGARWVPPERLPEQWARIDWSRTILMAHNARFDGAILWHHYGHRPAWWIDTQAWSQYAISQGVLPADASTSLHWWGEFLGLAKGDTAAAVAAGGDELAHYALRDLAIMRRVYEWLSRHCQPPALEALVIDLHVRMAAEPILRLDIPLLRRLAEGSRIPDDVLALVRSRERFAAALRVCGVEPETKTSPSTGTPTYAFDKTDAFLRSLAEHPDARVRKLHELRVGGASTIQASRAQRFLDVGEPLPVPLWYYGAHTGRSSGADKLNLQNLPRGKFRDTIVAPPGHRLVAADYSQIEARVVAWGAGDRAALAPFTSGQDPYKVVACELYGVDYGDVTPEQRQRAKAAVLALGFGQGVQGFLTYCQTFRIQIEPREAERIVRTWRAQRPVLVNWWRRLWEQAVRDGQLVLPSGRKLIYPDMEQQGQQVTYRRPRVFSRQRTGRDVVNLWHGLVVENWTQAVARDIIWHAAVRMPWKVALQVHDEVVLVVPEDEVDAALPEIERVMLDVPEWARGLPVACGIYVGKTYGGCK